MKSRLTIVYAPPGKGKTTGVLDLFKELDLTFVFLSPLRAIAAEVFERAGELGLKTQWRALAPVREKTFVVSTFECFKADSFAPEDCLFIIDEFHLIYYWGESFRPILMETYYQLAAMNAHVVGLSATLGEEIWKRLKRDAVIGFDDFRLIDQGGGGLLFKPSLFLSMRGFNQSEQLLAIHCYMRLTSRRVLIFCAYRSEVQKVATFLSERGHSVVTCVGGEVRRFVEESHSGRKAQVIVATSVLGHGVNLGAIRLVAFLAPVKRPDFYLQMLARGGRDGGGFIVMHRQRGKSNFFERLLLWPFIKLISHVTL